MKNIVGKILSIIGLALIGIGIYVSIYIYSSNNNMDTLNREIRIICLLIFIISFIFGCLFIGFGEVIRLLQDNLDVNKGKNQTENIINSVSETDELPEI